MRPKPIPTIYRRTKAPLGLHLATIARPSIRFEIRAAFLGCLQLMAVGGVAHPVYHSNDFTIVSLTRGERELTMFIRWVSPQITWIDRLTR